MVQYCNSYYEIKKNKPLSEYLREQLRALALDTLCIIDKFSGVTINEPRIQFIYLHHVFHDEEQHLSSLVEPLRQNYIFISYSEAVEKILSGNIDKPYMCISFDDGFQNNLSAAKILKEHDIKACFFINPRFAEEQDFTSAKYFSIHRLKFPTVQFLNWKEIEQIQIMGHEIGSHSMEHKNLALLNEQELIDDIGRSFDIIKRNCGNVKHFSFPYGRYHHFNDIARKIVFQSGFISCASAERGCHVNDNQTIQRDKLCILRDHVLLEWKLDHILHFFLHNCKKKNFNNNFFPYP